jgi:ketosteroid isomerase-like protein
MTYTKTICAIFAALLCGAASPAPRSARSVIEAKFAAVNRHVVADIVDFYAEDAILTASDFCAPRHGRADVARTYEAIFQAIPDVRAEVVEYVVQGDRVAARVILHSRRPGQSFDFPLMNFFTVRAGRIVRDDGMFDNGGRPCRP